MIFSNKRGIYYIFKINNNTCMSSLIIHQSRAYHVIITWIVEVRPLSLKIVVKWPDSVVKLRQSPKVTLAQKPHSYTTSI